MPFVTRRPRVRTLRGRLTLLHVATLAITVGLFAVLAYVVLSYNLYRHHDEELSEQARSVTATLGQAVLNDATIRAVLNGAGVRSRLVMIRNDRGDLVYRDPTLETTEPNIGRHEALVHAARSGMTAPEFFTVDLERSGETRFICAPIGPSRSYLQIGDPLGDVRATLHSTALACLPLFPVVLVLSSVGGWLIASRALAPMQAVAATLREIHATDLSRRVEAHPHDEELEALVATINRLLDRLQRAFESVRQFAGDVSHQLQTPLTIMKATIQADLHRTNPAADAQQSLQSLMTEVNDLSGVVVNLRALALADSPVRDAALVDLSALVLESADIISALGEMTGVAVTTQVEPGVMVRGDAVRLKQVVLNLGDNAVKYTPAAGRVTIQLRATGREAALAVSDTGIGIAGEHLPHLFDRLYRSNAASLSTPGMGLGLAIAKRIIEVHRGAIDVRSEVGQGSTFEVRLPLG